MRKLPPLAAVRVFEAAARHGNFTTAAAELGMTQAAVSYQVRLLEERVGQKLFVRDRGRVSLSDAGRRLAPAVTGGLDAIAGAFATLRADNDAVLTISSASTFASNWLAPRLGAFQLSQPDLAVRLDASNVVVDFARDDVDVAIRISAVTPPDLAADWLFDNEITPMASPDFVARHGIAVPEDLLVAPRLTPGDDWWRVWFESAGVTPPGEAPPGMRFDTQIIEGAAALAGHGAALLTPRMWRRDLADGRLVAPFDLTVRTGTASRLVYPQARGNVAKIRAFRRWLLAEVAASEAGAS